MLFQIGDGHNNGWNPGIYIDGTGFLKISWWHLVWIGISQARVQDCSHSFVLRAFVLFFQSKKILITLKFIP